MSNPKKKKNNPWIDAFVSVATGVGKTVANTQKTGSGPSQKNLSKQASVSFGNGTVKKKLGDQMSGSNQAWLNRSSEDKPVTVQRRQTGFGALKPGENFTAGAFGDVAKKIGETVSAEAGLRSQRSDAGRRKQYFENKAKTQAAYDVWRENPDFGMLSDAEQNDLYAKKYFEIANKNPVGRIAIMNAVEGSAKAVTEAVKGMSSYDYKLEADKAYQNDARVKGLQQQLDQLGQAVPKLGDQMSNSHQAWLTGDESKVQATNDIKAKIQEAENELQAIKAEHINTKRQAYINDLAKLALQDKNMEAVANSVRNSVPEAKGFDRNLHAYINNMNTADMGLAPHASREWTDKGNFDGWEKYRNLTKDELTLYNYFVGSGQYGKAKEFLEALDPYLNARQAEIDRGEAEKFAKENPIASNIYSVLSSVAEAPGAIGSTIVSNVTGAEIDPNSPWFTPTLQKNTIRGTTSENIDNPVLKTLYTAGMSMADNVASLVTTGGSGNATLALMGNTAATSTMQNVKARGGTDEQAMGMALLAGVAEVLTEKMPLDNFLSLTGGRRTTIVKDLLKQAGMEGTEEMISETAATIADTLVMGDLSDYQQSVNQYMAQGLSANEARNRAMRDAIWQIAESGIIGSISGAGMGAVGSTVGNTWQQLPQDAAYVQQGVQDALENPAMQQAAQENARSVMAAHGITPEYSLGQDVTLADGTTGTVMARNISDGAYTLQTQNGVLTVPVDRIAGKAGNVSQSIATAQDELFAQSNNTRTDNSIDGITQGKGLVPYTTVEAANLVDSGQFVSGVNSSIPEFVDYALANRGTHKRLYLGRISPEVSSEINTQLDKNGAVDQYNMYITTDFIEKILGGKHGMPSEILRGQTQITPEILKHNLENIIANPDMVFRSEKDYNGKPTFYFTKEVASGYGVLLEVVQDKGKSLWPQTFYIRKKNPYTLRDTNGVSLPKITPEATGFSDSFTTVEANKMTPELTFNIPQNGENVNGKIVNNFSGVDTQNNDGMLRERGGMDDGETYGYERAHYIRDGRKLYSDGRGAGSGSTKISEAAGKGTQRQIEAQNEIRGEENNGQETQQKRDNGLERAGDVGYGAERLLGRRAETGRQVSREGQTRRQIEVNRGTQGRGTQKEKIDFDAVQAAEYTPTQKQITEIADQNGMTGYVVPGGGRVNYEGWSRVIPRGGALVDVEAGVVFLGENATPEVVRHEVFHVISGRMKANGRSVKSKIEKGINASNKLYQEYYAKVARQYGSDTTIDSVHEELAANIYAEYKENGRDSTIQKAMPYFKTRNDTLIVVNEVARVDRAYQRYLDKNRGKIGKVVETDTGLTRRMFTGTESGGGGKPTSVTYSESYTQEDIPRVRKEGKTFRNLIAGIDTTVTDFFNKWKNGRKSHAGEKLEKLYLGKTTDIANEDISNILGYDVDGRDFIITNDGVKHILDRHGKEGEATRQGNTEVGTEIINMLPEIVAHPDGVRAGDTGRDGRRGIIFEKNLPDGSIVYIQFDNKGRGTLEGKTIYIKKGTPSMSDTSSKRSPYHTSETTEPVPSTQRIAQDMGEVKGTESGGGPSFDTIGRGGNVLQRGFRTAYQNLVSAQEPLENIAKIQRSQGAIAGVDANTQLARQSSGTGEYIIEDGLVTRDGLPIDIPWKKVIEEIPKNELADFNEYAQNLHNIDRQAQGKPVNANTAEQSAEVVRDMEAKHPAFRRYIDRIQDWWGKFGKEWISGSGLVSSDGYRAMQGMYPYYIPTHRKGKGGGMGNRGPSTNKVVKKAKGGTTEIVPLEHAFVQQIGRIVNAARMNELNMELVEFARQNPQAAAEAGVTIAQKQKQGANIDVDALANVVDTDMLKVNENAEPNDGRYQVTAYENGQPVTMNVSEDVYNSLNRLHRMIDDEAIGGAMRALRKVGGVFKSAYTGVNPIFTITNALRDIQTYLVNTKGKNPFRVLSNYGKAIGQIVKKGDVYNQFRALGGDRSGFFGQIRRDARGNITKLPQKFWDKTVGEKVKQILAAPFNAISKVGNVIEQAPRLAEFMNIQDIYGNSAEAVRAGAYAGADVTTNFARSAPVTKAIDSFTYYFNAAVQGIDKTARQFKNHPVQTVGRSAVTLVLPAILLAIVNAGNPNYDELDDRTKNAYYLIPNMSDLDENGNAKIFIKLPRSREYGAIFGVFADRMLNAIESGDWGEEMKQWWEAIANDLLPPNPVTDNMFSPYLVNLPMNIDYAGRNIVPESMLDLEDKYQYDIKTSNLAKTIGAMLNVSPKKVDYLIDQFGYYGDLAQGLTSQEVSTPAEGLKKAFIEPFERRFVADPKYNSALTDKLYDYKDELNKKVKTSEFLGNPDGEEKEKLKALDGATGMIAELRTYEREIMGSDMTVEEKSAAIDNVREQMNDVARAALEAAGQGISEERDATMPQAPIEILPKVREDGTETKTALNAISHGIPAADFYEYDIELNKIAGDKDGNGDTIANTEGLKKKDYIDSLGLNEEQTQYLYDAYSVGEKVQSGDVTWDSLKRVKAINDGASEEIVDKFDAEPFMSEDTIDKSKGSEGQQKAQWIFDHAKSEDEIAALYRYAFEGEEYAENGDKWKSSIEYAMKQGVRPSKFVEFKLLGYQDLGDKEASEEIDWVDGKLVTTSTEQSIEKTRTRDIAGALLDGDYTEAEKGFLYQEEYPNDDKYVFSELAGLPIDEFLKMQRDDWSIKSDYNSKGVAITNSKRNKYIDYINGLDLSEAQKYLLLGLQGGYKLQKLGKADLVTNYINELGISDEEKQLLFEKLQLGGSSGGSSGRTRGGRRGSSRAKYPKVASSRKLSRGKISTSVKIPNPVIEAVASVASGKWKSSGGNTTGKASGGMPSLKVKDTILRDTMAQEKENLAQSPILKAFVKPVIDKWKERMNIS